MKIRIATRKSKLALWQTRYVAATIKEHHPDVEVEEIHVVTQGDKIQDKPLYEVGGKALFVSEVEAYVVRGEADLAVHSLKDVPGDVTLAEGCDLLCLPEREDPRDVLLTRDGEELMGLVAGSRVGTTSLRRTTQIKAQRPDLAFATLRGNVDTRLRKLDEGGYDAIILAAAGLKRLGLLEGRKYQFLSEEMCLPAVGQGTLAIEGRVDSGLREVLACLEHPPTRIRTEAERALLLALQGSCRVPIAGHATLHDDGKRLTLNAMVGGIHGERLLSAGSDIFFKGRTDEERGEEARALGVEVAEGLIARGARELMAEAVAATHRLSKLN
ncbi:MAG: hydroxymethylbilane synthase [Polyangiales bacterium]